MRGNKTSNTMTEAGTISIFFACTLMSKPRMDSPAFLLVFVPFHVIWSKTGGEREEMKKVHCLLA